MKTILFTVAIVAICAGCFAQTPLPTDYPIQWENGDETILSDLGTVWIKLESGSTIKDAKIREINPSAASLVYQKESTEHDLGISQVKNIRAGLNSRSVLYFDQQNYPRIKPSGPEFEDYRDYTDFAVTRKAYEIQRSAASAGDTLIQKQLTNTREKKDNYDIIVRPDGSVINAIILSISATEITYRRSDIPNGPLYVISVNHCSEIIKTQDNYKIIMQQNK